MLRASDDLLRLGHMAQRMIERDIAGHIRIDLRRAGRRRRARIDSGRKRIDVDDDCFRRLARLDLARSHDERDGVADIADLVRREKHRAVAAHRRTIVALQRERTFGGRVGREIGAGVDRQHAGHGAGFVQFNGRDHAMRMAAAHDDAVQLAFDSDVVGIAAPALHQRRVFRAPHGLADREFGDIVERRVHQTSR